MLRKLIMYDSMAYDCLADTYLPIVNSIWEQIDADKTKFSEAARLKAMMLKALLSYLLVIDSDQAFWKKVHDQLNTEEQKEEELNA